MNNLISAAAGVGYRRLAKPVLFCIPPDTVHTRMIRTASTLQRSGAVRGIVHAGLAYQDPLKLGHSVSGIWFSNPVGLSAGFDKNFELAPMMRSVGFGFMEGGSVTFRPCEGNPRPWFYRLPKSKSLVVHVGLANHGVEKVMRRIKAYDPSVLAGFPLNISVAQTNSKTICSEDEAVADYMGSLEYIKRAGLGQLLTINISCPNTYRGEPFTSPRMLDKLLSKIDALDLSVPLFIKMPNHLPWTEFEALLRVASKHAVSGVTISNLAKRESGVSLADDLPERIKGGLSGKPTWERSNELIRRTYKTYGDRFVIIGVGGIFSAEDAYTKIRLGASLVELITGMVFEGPALVGRINRELGQLLERDGFTNIRDAIGVDVRR